MVAQDPPILDPRHWLPEILLYTNAHREVWAVQHENVTWPDLVQAYQTHDKGRVRARKYGWQRAFEKHDSHLHLLTMTMEVFAPLMQANPTLTFADACARMSPQSRKVTNAL